MLKIASGGFQIMWEALQRPFDFDNLECLDAFRPMAVFPVLRRVFPQCRRGHAIEFLRILKKIYRYS